MSVSIRGENGDSDENNKGSGRKAYSPLFCNSVVTLSFKLSFFMEVFLNFSKGGLKKLILTLLLKECCGREKSSPDQI